MEGTYYSGCKSSCITSHLRVLYNSQSPLPQKSVKAVSLIMTTVGLEKFHSKAIILRDHLVFAEKRQLRRKFSPARNLQFPIIFSHAKENPPRPACLGFLWRSFDQNSTEILSEPEVALEELDNQSGRPHTLCAGHIVLGHQGRVVPSSLPFGLLWGSCRPWVSPASMVFLLRPKDSALYLGWEN